MSFHQEGLKKTTTTRLFVCLFAWGLTALSAQIGYIAITVGQYIT